MLMVHRCVLNVIVLVRFVMMRGCVGDVFMGIFCFRINVLLVWIVLPLITQTNLQKSAQNANNPAQPAHPNTIAYHVFQDIT